MSGEKIHFRSSRELPTQSHLLKFSIGEKHLSPNMSLVTNQLNILVCRLHVTLLGVKEVLSLSAAHFR